MTTGTRPQQENIAQAKEIKAQQPLANFTVRSDTATKKFLKPEMGNLSYKNYAALKALTILLIREIEEAEKSVPESYNFSLNKRISLQDEVHRFEANLIRNALIHSRGSQTRAALILGIRISTLHEKMKRFGIDAWDLKKLSAKQV